MAANLPPTAWCTDLRHTGRIREQLGCTGPDPATLPPIEPGQVYRPTEYNAARLPEDRATITTVHEAGHGVERTIAYDIQSTDHRGRPSQTSSATRESVFRRSYVLDVPEPSPEDIAPEPETQDETVARALALLDSLDAAAYVLVRPDADGNLDATASSHGMSLLDAASAFRAAASEFKQQATLTPVYAGLDERRRDARDRDIERARIYRDVADDIEAANASCNAAGICPGCSLRAQEAAKLRTAATELEATSCTCGVPSDPTAVHRTDAPCYVKDTDQ
ncbi:hypothetical protein ACFUGD_06560 [Streptomyces sp. NPDC057217]|uniref:hypothetical protein n=1 Tax=Streptomyces sp. NPDC057217 TaxID=3346054 RepID=UPI0036342715